MGFSRKIAPERIKSYVQYCFSQHLFDHFEWEETIVFPLVEEQNPLRKKALSQHKKLRKLYERLETEPEKWEINLGLIEELLENHIRFEERELFNYIQDENSESILDKLGEELNHVHTSFIEDWSDSFWDKTT